MNINTLFLDCVKARSQLINFQTVRWRRPKKPFWLGIAKSKISIVPGSKCTEPPEETAQNKSLMENYNMHLKSLLNFVRNSDPKLQDVFCEKSVDGKIIRSLSLEAEISKSLVNNDSWNAESARRREKRMKECKEKFLEEAFKIIEKNEEIKRKEMEEIEDIVRKEKLLSDSYITAENIDEAIENCLNKIENYDFAIDLDGSRYLGNESLAPQLHNQKVETATSTTA